MIRKLLLFVVLFFLHSASFGQVLWTNNIDGTNPGNTNPFTTGQTFDSNITVLGISRSGVTGANGNNRFNATGWPNTFNSNSNYFEFTLTPNSGNTINFINLIYTGQASSSGTGAANVSNFAVRSSIDNYSTNIGAPAVGGGNISLSGASYQGITGPITFRIYAWGGGGTRQYSINDFTFNGVVCSPAPTTTDVTICQGDSGSLTASFSSGTTVTSNTFSGSWNAATDPTARIITTSMNNSQTCGFGTAVRNYTAINFTVNVTGNYIFKMTDTNDYDGMAYIYTGNFTPGTCGGGGTWIIGDDDNSGSQAEPRMTRNLTAGVVYTLISTTFSASSDLFWGL